MSENNHFTSLLQNRAFLAGKQVDGEPLDAYEAGRLALDDTWMLEDEAALQHGFDLEVTPEDVAVRAFRLKRLHRAADRLCTLLAGSHSLSEQGVTHSIAVDRAEYLLADSPAALCVPAHWVFPN